MINDGENCGAGRETPQNQFVHKCHMDPHGINTDCCSEKSAINPLSRGGSSRW